MQEREAARNAASMGPRSADRGNIGIDVDRRPVNVLQWGRDQLIAEIHYLLSNLDFMLTLQWGRDQLIAEMGRYGDPMLQASLLQWGRDQLIAEMTEEQEKALGSTTLQWGRDQLIAEIAGLYPI